jgi:hypothetical protein
MLVRHEEAAAQSLSSSTCPADVADCWCDVVEDDCSHWDAPAEGDDVPHWDRYKDRHRCGRH